MSMPLLASRMMPALMHKHFLIVLGNWKFENWHLYRLREHCNHNGKVRWRMWDQFFDAKEDAPR